MSGNVMTPKVFISYCWNGQERQDKIVELAERLATDGVESIVDIYDLKEGDDKYHFMEKMVVDETVSHVLIICDKNYSLKADSRKSGVGTESLIISQEIYSKASQSKFIPIIVEFDENGDAYTPIFLKSRIYIDFSSPEKENSNWERLIRLLYGKPELVKPALGNKPSYLEHEEKINTYGIESKFNSLKEAILSNKKTVTFLRSDFFNTCFSFIDSLRIRKAPEDIDFPQCIIDDFKKLSIARDALTDWCLLESSLKQADLSDNLILVVENLLELSSRPEDLNSYQDVWFHAHKAFAYECMLYITSSLIKNNLFQVANELITSHYKLPATSSYGNAQFCGIEEFYYHSDYLQEKLSPPGRKLNSTMAELFKINANRADITFHDIMQSDLIITMFSLIEPARYWFPQTLYYAPYSYRFPFFTRAATHKGFEKLLILSGATTKDKLKESILNGINIKGTRGWSGGIRGSSYNEMLNIDNWDTLK
ncbi:TIR domain-containing protein [Escherichia coli O121]|uniref:SEFIR domain-containing protein n=1 Tax=Enterobacteriaceae TaxID=543 RepID=UPI001D672B42|nr:TIR domain-containing protein [Escherichia coli]EKF2561292.1 TIR domain-containing protein [Escherichia coli O103]EKK9179043.1 TIR domain-containing protein [Escherichia coli O121]EKK9191876.1 TIR domain-containing protein [Escherichia coli O121]EKK9196638.1 TIR domain-containing protein [Escherichia coli O121]